MSTEPIELCKSCGAPMASDQRYCLDCGERRIAISSVLSAGPPGGAADASPAPAPRPGRPPSPRNHTLTVIAGVGVLMVAMGVGVLIGREGSSTAGSAGPQVISVASGPVGTGAIAAGESFASDWPGGKAGYTVQLQTLPQSGTRVSAVQAAKIAAGAKGAKNVGALKSDEFSSLPSGDYVIYSGEFTKKAEAEKAFKALVKSFPSASLIQVSSHGGSSSAAGSGSSGAAPVPPGTGNSLSHPAPPSVLEGKPKKGGSYEQKSRNLPNVISTG